MKTLITTGCSYTQHNFPCWNIWLGEHYDNHISFAQSGSGPRYSYLQIRDFFKYTKNINPKDYHVIVQWSSLLRRDTRFSKPSSDLYRFKMGGQIDNNPFYTKEYVEDHFSLLDVTCDLLYYVESLILLSKELGFKLNMLYMFEPWVEDFYGEPLPNIGFKDQHHIFHSSPYLSSLKQLYKSEYFIPLSIEKFCFFNEKSSPIYWWNLDLLKPYDDHHPSPLQHFKYYNFLAKKLGLLPPKKEWELIASQLEDTASSKELSLKFTTIWMKDYPWITGLEYANGHIFNIDLEYVKNKLYEINTNPKII